MRDRPSGAELLFEARRVLREEIAPELEGEARYKVLMAANAVAMAMRELEHGEAPLRQEYESFATLYGETRRVMEDTHDLEEQLLRLNRLFAQEIRSGRRDGEGHSHQLLMEQAISRVRDSNPDALQEVT